MTSTKFTYTDALAIQREHLAQWRLKLNAECYTDLIDHVAKVNKRQGNTNPYDVFRGQDIDTFIANWKPGHKGTNA